MLQLAIGQLSTIEERLEVLIPRLADRWGVVTAHGVVLPAFFSHTLLSALVGVRRPSLTTALASLTDPSLLRRLPDRRWLVAGSARERVLAFEALERPPQDARDLHLRQPEPAADLGL
jgi:hypothetical protein